MIRLVIFLVTLLIGFGGGVYFAHKFPGAAAKISAEEEKRFLEAQLAITQKIKAKLEELSAKESTTPPDGTSGFLSAGQARAAGADAKDVKELRAQTDAQEALLRQRIEELE